MKIPAEADWRSEPWDLDIPSAYAHFFGKSLEEAISLFNENSLSYQEDLMFMPLPCFRYYLLAYTHYLLSASSRGDSDGANCFFGIVEIRKNDIRASSERVLREVTQTLEKLANYQGWYNATEHVYGIFRDRASACLKLIQSAQGC
jgi:hypothetical protein